MPYFKIYIKIFINFRKIPEKDITEISSSSEISPTSYVVEKTLKGNSLENYYLEIKITITNHDSQIMNIKPKELCVEGKGN